MFPAPDDQNPLRQTVAEIPPGQQRVPSPPQDEVGQREEAVSPPKTTPTAAAPVTVPPAGAMPAVTKGATAGQADVPVARPSHRPPMAVLWIFDDGGRTSEQVRIRGGNFVIGRTEGDLKIGHDVMLSSKHAEIVRVQQDGGWRWHLYDLNSSNGTLRRQIGDPER